MVLQAKREERWPISNIPERRLRPTNRPTALHKWDLVRTRLGALVHLAVKSPEHKASAASAREAVRSHPDVVAALEKWWATVLHNAYTFPRNFEFHPDVPPGVIGLNFPQYVEVYLRLFKALVSPFDDRAAQEGAESDWDIDAPYSELPGGKSDEETRYSDANILGRDRLFDAMFNIADTFCIGTKAEEFAAFLTLLLRSVAEENVIGAPGDLSYKPIAAIEYYDIGAAANVKAPTDRWITKLREHASSQATQRVASRDAERTRMVLESEFDEADLTKLVAMQQTFVQTPREPPDAMKERKTRKKKLMLTPEEKAALHMKAIQRAVKADTASAFKSEKATLPPPNDDEAGDKEDWRLRSPSRNAGGSTPGDRPSERLLAICPTAPPMHSFPLLSPLKALSPSLSPKKGPWRRQNSWEPDSVAHAIEHRRHTRSDMPFDDELTVWLLAYRSDSTKSPEPESDLSPPGSPRRIRNAVTFSRDAAPVPVSVASTSPTRLPFSTPRRIVSTPSTPHADIAFLTDFHQVASSPFRIPSARRRVTATTVWSLPPGANE